MLLTFDIRMDIIVLEFDRKNSVIVVSLECNLISWCERSQAIMSIVSL